MFDEGEQSKDLFLSLLAMLPATLCLQAPDYTIRFTNRRQQPMGSWEFRRWGFW